MASLDLTGVMNNAVADELQRYIDERITAATPETEAPQMSAADLQAAIREAIDAMGGLQQSAPTDYDPIAANPVTYGASPDRTGDATPAFLKAAQATGAIYLAPGDRFQLNSTLVLGFPRVKMIGQGPAHFGDASVQVFRGPDIPADAWTIENLWFGFGASFNFADGLGIKTKGYCSRFEHCSFTAFDIALGCDGGVTENYLYCQFVGGKKGIADIRENGGDVTTIRLIGTTFQYVTDCFSYPRARAFTCQFLHNVFERVNGVPIALEFARDCKFSDNWYEHRDDGEAGQVNIEFTRANECWGNWFGREHVQAGFVSYGSKNPAESNGMAGGLYHQVMSPDGDRFTGAHRTDGGFSIDRTGVYGHVALYGDYHRPFRVQAGRSREGRQPLYLETGSKLSIFADYGVDLLGSGSTGEFGRPFRFVTGAVTRDVVRDDGSTETEIERYRGHSLEATRGRWGRLIPGLNGKCEMAENPEAAGRDAYGIMTVPIRMLVRSDGRGWGTEAFETVAQTETGSIRFEKAAFQIENAALEVAVDDVGIEYDGVTWLSEETTGTNRYARGFELHFYNRRTGEPAAPESVTVTLSVVNSSDQ